MQIALCKKHNAICIINTGILKSVVFMGYIISNIHVLSKKSRGIIQVNREAILKSVVLEGQNLLKSVVLEG